MNPRYAPMFAPYTLNNGVAIKNRFVVAPLTIYESDANGGLTDAARNFWRDRFRGFGLFVMPFTNVHPTGIGFPSPNAFDASYLPTLREYAAISHEQGAKIVAQIAHAGSRANPLMTRGLGAVAPSAYGRVREMSSDEVAQMVQHFAHAAELALDAGLDGVEIHGANGWLIQQFVSAATNLRQDQWGGSRENRFRFPLAAKPLQYLHVSLWDFYKKARRDGNDEYRMKLIHQRINGRLPFIGVGKLYTADDIAQAWETGWAEFIALGKTVMLNPDLIELIANGREAEIHTHFDWQQTDRYRYTPAMLAGTRQGMGFYPPAKG